MADWTTTRTRHGTASGWRLHKDLGEQPCDACARAKREYDQRRLLTPVKAIRNRQHAAAQRAALSELQHRYPDEYRDLYLAQKARILTADASLGAASTTRNPPPSEQGEPNA